MGLVGHERQLFGARTDVLEADVMQARAAQRLINLVGLRHGRVIVRKHEDEVHPDSSSIGTSPRARVAKCPQV